MVIPLTAIGILLASCAKPPEDESLTSTTVIQRAAADAEFPGGVEVIISWISERIEYPAEAKKEGKEGAVFLGFTVEQDGVVSNVQVRRGVSPQLGQAAIDVVSQRPKWKPATKDGKAVACEMKLPLKYSLD